jgi:hypothetical protein
MQNINNTPYTKTCLELLGSSKFNLQQQKGLAYLNANVLPDDLNESKYDTLTCRFPTQTLDMFQMKNACIINKPQNPYDSSQGPFNRVFNQSNQDCLLNLDHYNAANDIYNYQDFETQVKIGKLRADIATLTIFINQLNQQIIVVTQECANAKLKYDTDVIMCQEIKDQVVYYSQHKIPDTQALINTKEQEYIQKQISYNFIIEELTDKVTQAREFTSIVLFEHINYDGAFKVVPLTYDTPFSQENWKYIWNNIDELDYENIMDFNDAVSSILVPPGIVIWLFEDIDKGGRAYWFYNYGNLNDLRDFDFNDTLSSVATQTIGIDPYAFINSLSPMPDPKSL